MKRLVTLTTVDGIHETFLAQDDIEKEGRLSEAWFCRRCGHCFAWLHVPGQPFMAVHSVCASCHSPFQNEWVPGSVWHSWDSALVSSYPASVLNREIILLCNHIERLTNERDYSN